MYKYLTIYRVDYLSMTGMIRILTLTNTTFIWEMAFKWLSHSVNFHSTYVWNIRNYSKALRHHPLKNLDVPTLQLRELLKRPIGLSRCNFLWTATDRAKLILGNFQFLFLVSKVTFMTDNNTLAMVKWWELCNIIVIKYLNAFCWSVFDDTAVLMI